MFHRTIATGLLAAALLAPALPASVPAQVTGVTVRVDGLSCPFCAYSLEKKLKEVDGVENLVINVDEGVATFGLAEGQGADFDVLAKVVKKAGFTPRGIHVQGIGRVETVSGRMMLVSKDGTPLFLLEANERNNFRNGTSALQGQRRSQSKGGRDRFVWTSEAPAILPQVL